MAEYPTILRLLREIANATPNPCEGSRGDIRDSFVWNLEEDWREAGNAAYRERVFDVPMTADEVEQSVIADAWSAFRRWMQEDNT